MTGPNAKTFNAWREARRKAASKLTETQGKMAREVLNVEFQNHKAINGLIGELEAKYKTYVTAYERIK